MTTKTFEQVKQILVERFAINASQIQPTADLNKDLNLDSMDSIDLLLAINELFEIRMPETTLENIHTVSELVSVVEKYRPKSQR